MRKTLLTIGMTTLLTSASVFAANCSSDRNAYSSGLSPHECATVATGIAGATASGIYSARKYSQAKVFEASNTQSLFSSTGEAAVMDVNRGQTYVGQITDGDKVSFTYELSETQNRQHHINLMESNADSARSSAAHHRYMAISATKTVTEKVGDSTVTTVEADHSARMMHASMALSKDQAAIDYDRKAMDARNGGQVPTYTLDKVVNAETGTKNLSQDFINERNANQSKIKSIKRLPALQFAGLKKMVLKARGGLVGVGVGLVFAGEEMISGAVAAELEENDIDFKIDID